MPLDHLIEFIKSIDTSTARSDDRPIEEVAFYYGGLYGQTFDGLAVDPNNPNTDVDGRDFLVWQRGLPAVPTDDGLLLPAVRIDDGAASIKDGTSNTVMVGEVVKPSPTGRTDGVFTVVLPELPTGDEVLVAFEFGDKRKGSDYSGTHVLYQDVFVPAGAVAMETLTIAHEGLLI
jgi:hypothetical protein